MNKCLNVFDVIYVFLTICIILGCSNPEKNTVQIHTDASDTNTIVKGLDTTVSNNNLPHNNQFQESDSKNKFEIPFGVNIIDINTYNKSRNFLDSLSKSVCSQLKLKNEILYNLPKAESIIHLDPFSGKEIDCGNKSDYFDFFPFGNYTHSFNQINGLLVYYLTINVHECEFLPNKIENYCDSSLYGKFGYLMFYDASNKNLIVIDAFHRQYYGEWSKVRLFNIDESSIIHIVEYDSNEGGIEIMNKVQLYPHKDSIGNIKFIKSQ
jgi:hypothetical protein